MGTSYEQDIVLWAQEQAALLKAGQVAGLDFSHLAEEIEDVGKSEQRELANRMAILLAHLLKWRYQPQRRGSSWEATIHTQRNSIERRLRKTPSLKASLADPDWLADAWDDAVAMTVRETGLPYSDFPESCPWPFSQILDHHFQPAAIAPLPL